MGTAQPARPLPTLRSDLRLLEGARSVSGEPTWLIQDLLHNRFVQIDVAGYEILSHWPHVRTVDELVARVNESGKVAVDSSSTSQLIDFLHQNNLTESAPRGGWRHFSTIKDRSKHSPIAWLIHNYLFMRIPLIKPQKYLERTMPLALGLCSRTAIMTLSAMGFIGLYLAMRQWDEFASTFQYFFTWEGAAMMAIGLGFVKIMHELGHAYTAVYYGCRVHTMGIAVLVMAPLPYTDVTDAWRLTDRRQRLAIDSAGIKAELGIAAVALFAWAFLPAGPLRSLAYVLSAVSIVSSLAVNLNPLMRFDGYYLLSEMLGVENLQQRSFAIGRWRMREWLFGLGVPCPEQLPRRLTVGLVVYAWSIWIYRLFLFIGIAVLVYYYFFKALGIVLFAIEIMFFVARPIWSELRYWFVNRKSIAKGRHTPIAVGMLALLVVGLLTPWSTRVEIPAVLESKDLVRLFPPRPAMVSIVHVKHGATVRAGEPLVTLASPELVEDLVLTRTRLRQLQLQHARRGGDRDDREDTAVLESSIAALYSKIDGLIKEQAELVVRAPFAGQVVEQIPNLHVGRWVGMREPLVVVSDPTHLVARGYVSESDLWRIAAGAEGRFIPDMAQRPAIRVAIADIASSGSNQIDIQDLGSIYSGRIAVTIDERRRMVPASAQYLVKMPASTQVDMHDLAVRGVVIAEGKAESLVARFWRHSLKVLVRESGA